MKHKRLYFWQGLDEHNQLKKSEMLAESLLQARLYLLQQNNIPIKIRSGPRLRNHYFKHVELLMITRQLATMLLSGLPLIQSFTLIINQHSSPYWRLILSEIKQKVISGLSLSESLNQYPMIFPPLYRQLTATGELTGQLAYCLQELINQQEKALNLQKKIKKALRYPLFLSVVTVLVTTIMLMFVLPQFTQIYTDFGANLPFFTRLIIAASQKLRENIIGITLSFAVLSPLSYYLIYPRYQERIEQKLLKIPLLGHMLNLRCLTLLFQNLTMTQRAGISLIDGLKSANHIIPYRFYRHSLQLVKYHIEQGKSFSQALSLDKLYPELCIQFICIGEESGTLDLMLEKLALYYQQETEELIDNFVQRIEPLMMTLIGLIIGSLIIAMYLPIFQLGNVIL